MLRLHAAVLVALLFSSPIQPQAGHHLFFRIAVSSELKQPVSGRLLVFLVRGEGTKDISASPFAPEPVSFAAKEIRDVAPGALIEIDTDDIAYPSGFSQLKAGNYRAQALVDTNHSYNYFEQAPGDVVSDVTSLPHFDAASNSEPVLTLKTVIPPASMPPLPAATRVEDFISPALTRFYGREVHMRALVVAPPHYADHPSSRYPAAYFTQGFGGSLARSVGDAKLFSTAMDQAKMPEMFWILLDESLPTGTHEFADSVNNGPWGEALTQEFIPYLEHRYRLDPRAPARFLNGHSSGGWATMWLQVTYPTVFGGTWSTSPDPVDFHDFSGVDLYAPHANVFHCANATPCPIVRDGGKVLSTLEQFAHFEATLGPYGGQFASFEWVFSPRGPDGRPLPMFDRSTGDVDAEVVRHWQNYDIAHTVQTRWPQLARNLDGKIHIYVGTADTFYLDGAVHKLDAVLKSLGAHAAIHYLEGRTHMNVYLIGDDRHGLFQQIAKDMYATWQASLQHPHKP